MARKKKKQVSRYFVRALFLLLIAILFSQLASVSWFFDLFSHFVVQYAFLAVIISALLFLSRRFVWGFVAFVVAISQLSIMIPLWQGREMSTAEVYEEVKILQFNVNKDNKKVNDMARWIISQSENVDIMVLMEITDRWQDALQRIKWAYPYHISKDVRGGRKMVILSKLLIDELEVKYLSQDEVPVVVMRGATVGYEVPFVLYGVHPPPPVLPQYAKMRNNIVESAAEDIAKERFSHKMLVGDFNSTRFSPVFSKAADTAGLYDSNEGLGIISTWPNPLPRVLGIAIDNIMISDNILVSGKRRGPSLGSDHYPIISTLQFKVNDKS
ncbi:endonuclease/exonuclease/phosphatase family protein [Rickettsiales bacterium]|nr:endonuclease/exonuclease/phosphatase family protein [Rickettsiales bacterium]